VQCNEIFVPGIIWYEKPAPNTGATKWSRFLMPLSGSCHGYNELNNVFFSVELKFILPSYSVMYMLDLSSSAASNKSVYFDCGANLLLDLTVFTVLSGCMSHIILLM